MKYLFSVALCICSFLLPGCKGDREITKSLAFTDPVLETCIMESDHHYYAILPDQIPSGQKIPLLMVIDPHGDGLTTINRFKNALEGLPLVIAASNKVENNYSGFEASLENMKNDLLTKYAVDPRFIIVSGFSGGARMAYYYGLNSPVHGIIMFGAGPDQHRGPVPNKPIYAVSGTRDFNFSEQYRPLFRDFQKIPPYLSDYFRGTHSWPPESYILEAVVFCMMQDSDIFRELAGKHARSFLMEADSLEKAKDLLFAGKALEKAWYFAAGDQKKALTGQIDAFKNNPEWKAYQGKIDSLLKSEEKMKYFYAEHLVDPDTVWWNGALNHLKSQMNFSQDSLEKDYYYRLKGFLGIYLYSQINTFLQKQGPGDLTLRLIRIYEELEPDSEDLKKFKAQSK